MVYSDAFFPAGYKNYVQGEYQVTMSRLFPNWRGIIEVPWKTRILHPRINIWHFLPVDKTQLKHMIDDVAIFLMQSSLCHIHVGRRFKENEFSFALNVP